MKKSFLMALLLMSWIACISQTGIYSGGIGSHKPQELRKTGLMVRPEMGFALLFDHIDDAFIPVAVDVGYQLSPRFFAGGGMAFYIDYSCYHKYNPDTGISRLYRSQFIPFYANVRWYWFEDPSSPFLELNTGFVLFKKANWDSQWEYDWSWQPAIGYDINNFDIRIWADIFRYKYYYHDHDVGFGVGVSLGYGILLKQK